ncbi:restriction endonuclease [Nonomuraea sp. NPDC049419]|uniref:restriction endonuclease n=1 Tax=Nonomuraea sp. NPDC049419 TaxID=3155772 RepID=UPI003413BF18
MRQERIEVPTHMFYPSDITSMCTVEIDRRPHLAIADLHGTVQVWGLDSDRDHNRATGYITYTREAFNLDTSSPSARGRPEVLGTGPQSTDVASNLEAPRNLLELSPSEFEHLVRQLFTAMGTDTWTTMVSEDSGVDAVATSNNLLFGGVCLIQAKRWSGTVGLAAVHALSSAMEAHNVVSGVLVTTSWFSRASERFAERNRITLINGAAFKTLIKEHLHIDVIPGTTRRT